MHLRRTLVLPNVLENELVQNCLTMEQRYYALRRMAFRLEMLNILKLPFNQEQSKSGKTRNGSILTL